MGRSMKSALDSLDFVPDYDNLKDNDIGHKESLFIKQPKSLLFKSQALKNKINLFDKFNKDILTNKDWGNSGSRDQGSNIVMKVPNRTLLNNQSLGHDEFKYRSIFTDTAEKALNSAVDHRKLKITKKLNEKERENDIKSLNSGHDSKGRDKSIGSSSYKNKMTNPGRSYVDKISKFQ